MPMAEAHLRRGRGVGIGDWVRIQADRDPHQLAIDDRGVGRTLSFGELNDRVNRVANGLGEVGIARGNRVALLAVDSHAYLETLLACAKLGSTAVPLNVRLSGAEVANLLDASGATVLVASERYAPMIDELRERAAALRDVIAIGDPAPFDAAIPFEEVVARASDREVDLGIDDEHIVGLAYTSGTTGLPKGVRQSQRMLKALVMAQLIETQARPDECRYSAAPLFHVAGYGLVLQGICRGFPNILNPSFDAAAILQWLQADALTGCFLVPTMLSTLLRQPGIEGGTYERLRYVQYGAAPMYPALLERAASLLGCDFIQGFGAGTEAGAQAFLSIADHRRARAGATHLLSSVGRAATGVELRICDDDWNELPRGEVGEIVTRGDGLMSGYEGDETATAHAMHPEGWFRAGDLGRLDDEGYLYLAGRKKDMVIRGGENVYPLEIEAVLSDAPGVVEVAVTGVDDEHWGEIVQAHLVLGADPPEIDALRDYCRARLAPYKVPSDWVVHTELPKNASGKILKRVLREKNWTVTS